MAEATLEPVKSPRSRPGWQERLRSNPVMVKELRSRMRGGRAFAILTAYLALLALVAGLTYLAFTTTNRTAGSVDERQIYGKVIFGIIVWLELTVVSFTAPALTAGAIAAEREHQTYDLLRATLLSARSLVFGKFASGLAFILLLLFAALPLQSLAFLFGGIAPEEVLGATGVLIATAVSFCAVGIFCSSFTRRTLVATVLAYGFAILLVFGLPILFLIGISLLNTAFGGGFTSQLKPGVETVLFAGGWLLVCLNPSAALLASEVVLLDQQSLFLFKLPLTHGGSLTLLSPWLPNIVLSLLFSLVLLWLSIRTLRRMEQ